MELSENNLESQESIQSFKDRLKIFAEESSVVGLKYIFSQSHFLRRAIWLFILLFGFSAVMVVVINNVTLYMTFGVDVKLIDEYQDELVFPAVTICNINRYRKSVIDGTDFETWLLGTFQHSNNLLKKNKPDPELVANLDRTNTMLKAAHQKEDIRICQWNDEYCGIENFTTTLTERGVCYTFNSDRTNLMKANRFGETNGLKLIIDIEKEEYTFSSPDLSSGIKVAIYPQDEPSFLSYRGLSVPPQSSATISMLQNERINKPAPYETGCQAGGLKSTPRNSIYGCYAEIIGDEVLKQCKCVEPYMKIYFDKFGGNERVCNFNESLYCADKIVESISLKCPTPCHAIDYSYEISYANFPSNHVLSDMSSYLNKSTEEVRGTYLSVTVFFKKLVSKKIVEVEGYTGEALMGNLGGIFGLWLGDNILTIYECFEFVIMFVIKYIKNIGRNKIFTR